MFKNSNQKPEKIEEIVSYSKETLIFLADALFSLGDKNKCLSIL